MRRWSSIIVVTLGAVALAHTTGCDKIKAWLRKPLKSTQTAPAWSPERIAQDPASYLAYSATQIGDQITERKHRLETLAAKKTEITNHSDLLSAKLADAENLRRRLATAIQHATEDDQWPLKFAGRTFERPQAEAILKTCQEFIADRRPLERAYDDALRRITETIHALEKDIADLSRLQEKIAIDLERVRLNQGLVELTTLRQRAAEVTAASETLVDLTTDPLAGVSVPTNNSQTELSIDSLIGTR